MNILLLVIIFVSGLCLGSFVNMLVYRTAINYGLEKRKFRVKNNKRSFCDGCGRQLKLNENIPVLSWLVQKGNSRCCGKKLSVLYPIVELMMGVLFLMVWLFGAVYEPLQLILGFIIVTFLVFSAVFDIRYMILPDFSTIILISSALIFWIIGRLGDWSYLWSGLASFGFLGLLYLVTQKKGMGLGDVKLAFFMGVFLGKAVIVAFYIAFIVGAVVALLLVVFKKANRKTLVPFGPFLILGTLVSWFWESQLVSLSVFLFIR